MPAKGVVEATEALNRAPAKWAIHAVPVRTCADVGAEIEGGGGEDALVEVFLEVGLLFQERIEVVLVVLEDARRPYRECSYDEGHDGTLRGGQWRGAYH